jgi:mRNA interferase HigB
VHDRPHAAWRGGCLALPAAGQTDRTAHGKWLYGSRNGIRAWLNEVREAQWTRPADIKAQFRSAGILKRRCAVFNIEGNDYRRVVSVAFSAGILYVKFVGTHEECDRIDAERR